MFSWEQPCPHIARKGRIEENRETPPRDLRNVGQTVTVVVLIILSPS